MIAAAAAVCTVGVLSVEPTLHRRVSDGSRATQNPVRRSPATISARSPVTSPADELQRSVEQTSVQIVWPFVVVQPTGMPSVVQER